MITDLTTKHPRETLWRFALLVFTSVMFQQFYNIADSSIAGRFTGEDTLVAIEASYPVTVIFMTFAAESSLGASMVVSRLFGAKGIGRMKTAVCMAFIACGTMSLILIVLGYAFCGSVTRLIHTPDSILAGGKLYLKIYIHGLTSLSLYSVCTGIFVALKDPRTPLYFLIGPSLGNAALDYQFMAQLELGMTRVVWAVFVARGVSAILTLGILVRHLGVLKIDRRTMLLSTVLLGRITAIAVPSIMQQSVLPVGNMFVQEIVNQHSSTVIAGYSGTAKLNTFAINAFMSLGDCLPSCTAQNLETGKREETLLGFKTGVGLSFCTTIPFLLLYSVLSRRMMKPFLGTGSTRVIGSGMESLRVVSPTYFMISIKLMTDGII